MSYFSDYCAKCKIKRTNMHNDDGYCWDYTEDLWFCDNCYEVFNPSLREHINNETIKFINKYLNKE